MGIHRKIIPFVAVAVFSFSHFASAAPVDYQALLQEAFDKFKADDSGKNADYIPALAKVDSKLFGIAIVTVDGKKYEVGDSKYTFAIESIVKPFVLAHVLQAIGPDAVLAKLGADATGDAFNSVLAIEQDTARTVNPLVNAGAIATASLVAGENSTDKWGKIMVSVNRFAARNLALMDDVYQSEAATNQHNQAIAMLLKSYDRLYSDPEEATDLYTRACSIGVTTTDIATMGATLANGGVNPLSKEPLIDAGNAARVLAIMATAGMYEKSGTWLFDVGLPAKSGVGGGIVAVVPNRLAIAAFSPPLDGAGNSVRAQKAIRYLAEKLKANVFSSTPAKP